MKLTVDEVVLIKKALRIHADTSKARANLIHATDQERLNDLTIADNCEATIAKLDRATVTA